VFFLDDAMDRALTVNSIGMPGYTLVDTADPQALASLDEVVISGIAYAGTTGYAANEVLLPIIAGGSVLLQHYDVDTGELLQEIEAPVSGFPLGLVFDATDGVALVPIPGANVLMVADLGSGEQRLIDWQDEPGPTYVAFD
jgi:hypothetical protein